MSAGERFRGGGARSITRFLQEHQACDAGFEVGRESAESGRLKVACKGCGMVGGYAAADAVNVPALDAEAAALAAKGANATAAGGRAAGAPPTSGGAGDGADRPVRARPAQRPTPRWLVPALIALSLIGGGALIAIAALGGDDDDGSGAPAPAATVPSGPADEPAPRPSAASAPPEGISAKRTARLREKIRLQGQVFSDRFSVGVPPTWDSGTLEGGGTGLFSADGRASVRIYYEVGGEDVVELSEAAGRFLQGEHEGARVSSPAPKRIGSLRGRVVSATYPGGRERAVVLSSDGVAYLLLEQVEDDATPFGRLQANAVMRSFRPL